MHIVRKIIKISKESFIQNKFLSQTPNFFVEFNVKIRAPLLHENLITNPKVSRFSSRNFWKNFLFLTYNSVKSIRNCVEMVNRQLHARVRLPVVRRAFMRRKPRPRQRLLYIMQTRFGCRSALRRISNGDIHVRYVAADPKPVTQYTVINYQNIIYGNKPEMARKHAHRLYPRATPASGSAPETVINSPASPSATITARPSKIRTKLRGGRKRRRTFYGRFRG